MKGFLSKRTVLKAGVLQDHQTYCLQECMCEIFSPEILQAGTVKGLISKSSWREGREVRNELYAWKGPGICRYYYFTDHSNSATFKCYGKASLSRYDKQTYSTVLSLVNICNR